MDLSIRNVVETINSVAPDGLLDKSANLGLFHIDLDAANESATESLQKKINLLIHVKHIKYIH